CSSVKRLRFILWSSQWARAYFKMDYFNGARSMPNPVGAFVNDDSQESYLHAMQIQTSCVRSFFEKLL
ncbi:hypothetical protein, partial [Rhizobium laguerreae]